MRLAILLAALVCVGCDDIAKRLEPEKKPAAKTALQIENERRERAIELAKNGKNMAQGTYYASPPKPEILTNDYQIRTRMSQMTGDLKIAGWQVRKIDDSVYVVSYGFTDGEGTARAWPFEVNLPQEIVRSITGDVALEKKYGFLTR